MTHEAKLHAKDDAGGGLVRLQIEPPAEVARSYVLPGQYVELAAGGKKAYLVLAGDPGERIWELIVRPGGDAVTAVLEVAPGGRLQVSTALGKGFPMDEARGKQLMVIVTGSGIAAGRPVVRARVADREAASTELLLGVRTTADVPMESELREWSTEGVRVTVCLSRADAPSGRPGFAPGYVQDVAQRHARALPTPRRLIFAAGVKPMIDAVRALARDLGVHESDVRTNY